MIAAANSSVSYLAVLKNISLSKLIWTVTNLIKAVVCVCLRVRDRDREKVGERERVCDGRQVIEKVQICYTIKTKSNSGTHYHRTSLFTVFHM